MAKVFGVDMTKTELLHRVGNMDAIAHVRRVALTEGQNRGGDAYEVLCGKLRFTVRIDKCMDVEELYYEGVPLHFLARPGTMTNGYFADEPNSSRSITGGMMFTCGLSNVGPAQTMPGGKIQPQHGRIRTTPATNHGARAYWDGDDYCIELFGEMREASLFGENLVLRRSITAKLGEDCIHIRDMVENEGQETSGVMLMYHCNAGYPLLDVNSKLVMHAVKTTPRDQLSADGMAQESPFVFGAPEAGYVEQVFYHDLEAQDGRVRASLVNPDKKLAFTIDYDKANLPYLIHWKCRAAGDYVTGIEPSNCHPEGVHKERENGTLRVLKPLETMETDLLFVISTGEKALALL